MADVKISALPAAAAITGPELVPVVQGGVTSQTTASAILAAAGIKPFASVSYSPGASVNNAAPAGFSSTTTRLLVTPNAAGSTLTGLLATGFVAGDLLDIVNVSATDSLTLTNADTNSTLANRFNASGDFVIVPGQAITIKYESTSGWRVYG